MKGFHATRPVKGARINTHTSNANRYRNYLTNRQHTVLNRSGIVSKPVYRFTTVLNGVALEMTAQQASKLRGTPGVTMVEKNRMVTIQTRVRKAGGAGPDGPPAASELRSAAADASVPGPYRGARAYGRSSSANAGHAGKGVIIGDIDTGFWPENPSFAAFKGKGPDAGKIKKKFHGTCDTTGEDPVTCNNKVIGARFYNASGADTANPNEFQFAARLRRSRLAHRVDRGGRPVQATINGSDAGPLEGMAPGARLSIYKVLYENATNTSASGGSVDIDAAVEDAVNDGVDVINFSVGDNVDDFGLDELAFLNAAAAGVFVSAAAGNAGPGASTVDNAMPWETTDAAGTFDESFPMTVTLGNGNSYPGVGRGSGVGSSPLIDSVNAGLTGATPARRSCASPRRRRHPLDPAKVAGKIVLCKRGSQCPRGQEPRRPGGRRRRDDPLQRQRRAGVRRGLPLRPDRPTSTTRLAS